MSAVKHFTDFLKNQLFELHIHRALDVELRLVARVFKGYNTLGPSASRGLLIG